LRTDFSRSRFGDAIFGLCLPLLAMLCSGCRQDMHDQPRFEAYEKSTFFADQRAVRAQIPGTVAQGSVGGDPVFLTGKVGAEFVETLPIEVTRERLVRGRERFEIFCAPCHDRLGYGDGMIVKRGFPRPNSYHIERLRTAPAGHFFDVITNGIGPMGDYADRISPEDRWNIVAYIRVLQISQQSRLSDLPSGVREEFSQAVPQ